READWQSGGGRSLPPALTADGIGPKNLGFDHGLVFIGWGPPSSYRRPSGTSGTWWGGWGTPSPCPAGGLQAPWASACRRSGPLPRPAKAARSAASAGAASIGPEWRAAHE